MTFFVRRTLLQGSGALLASTALVPFVRPAHAAVPIAAIVGVVTAVLSAVEKAKFENNLNGNLEAIRNQLATINGKLDELISLVQRLPLEVQRVFDEFERKQLENSSKGALSFLVRLQESTDHFPIKHKWLRDQYEELGMERSKHLDYVYNWKALLYPAAANDICVVIASLFCANFLDDTVKKRVFLNVVNGSLEYFGESKKTFEAIRDRERQAAESIKGAINGFPTRGYLGFEYRPGRRGSREDPDGGTPPTCKHHYYNMAGQNFSTRFSCCQRPANFEEHHTSGEGCQNENPIGIAAPPGWPPTGVDFNSAWGKLDAIMRTLNAQIDNANAHYARADEADQHVKTIAEIIAEVEKWKRKHFG